ncbi:uncharacterized protein DDB_G0284459-like isoform X2 [Nymphalis io]|uniref:uncharacterized protein DDB_G0284459-like isoform X2 n=1 Tax=Inachis io TaxID=171585 RepID=UPI002169C33D|nr:uncharacterized protein DDB_G0284459-like isoform X2 [Nymphalis io]
MAGPKFFIYGGSRWREVCTTSGCVDGWGNVQFLTVRSGRLQLARKDTVLRGLRSLAACKPTTVHDGPPLSQIRYNKVVEGKKEHDCLQYQHHHCCCKPNDLRYNSDVIFNNIFKAASTCTTAVQCSGEVSMGASNSNKPIDGPSQTSARTKSGVKLLLAKRKRSSSKDEQPRKKHVQSNKGRNTSDEEIESSLVERRRIYHVDKDKNNDKNIQKISSSEDEQEKPRKKHVQSNKCRNTNERRRIYHVDKDKNNKNKSKNIYKNIRKISSSEDEQDVRNKNVKLTEHTNESDEEIGTPLVERRQIYDNYDKNKSKTRPRIVLSEDDQAEAVKGKETPVRSGKQSPVKSGNVLKALKSPRVLLRPHTINNKQEINKPNNIQSPHSSSDGSNGIQPKPAGKSSQTIEEILEEMFNTKPTRRPKRKLSSDDESYQEVRTSKRIVGRNQELVSKRTQEMGNGDHLCKELVIGEEDVQLLRTFIEKDKDNIFDVDLEKFDTDDNHKRAIFYKLNPLVNVARCKRIAVMLRERREQSSAVSLEDFISTLGLCSVLDTSSQASSKYKMRARRKPDSGPDKENHRSSLRKPNASSSSSMSKVLVEKLRDSGNKKKIISTKRRKAVGLIGKMSSRPLRSRKEVEVVSLSSDSDSVFEKSKRDSALETRKRGTSEVRRPDTGAALKRDGEKVEAKTSGTASRKANGPASGRANGRLSGKAGGREYTRSEDEAVVAWVRGAERARRVNGNQLWRELQPLHQQKTGHCELKSRKKPQRRNSLLSEPRVRSAWSRRPRPPARESPSPSRPVSPVRSPTPAPSSSLSPPVQVDSSHYSSRNISRSSSSSASLGDNTPTDRRRSLRNSSAKKSASTEKQTPRKLRSSTQASPPPRARTPTYSQLTRRFADERPPRPPRSPPAPPAAAPPRPRTRRLYNPNAT